MPGTQSNGTAPDHLVEGFTLIEVLTAFAICALSLGVLLQVFSTGLRNTTLSEAHSTAALLAESKLATVGRAEPIAAGESEGRFDERFGWRIAVSPYQEESFAPRPAAPQPYRVEITVFWDEDDEQRNISITTLRLAKRG